MRFHLAARISTGVVLAALAGGTLAAPGALAESPGVSLGLHASAISVDSGLGRVYVTSDHDNLVTSFDEAAPEGSTRTVTVGAEPIGVAVDSVTHRVFVANAASKTISAFDGTVGSPVVATIPLRSIPTGIAVDPVTHTVLVTSQTTDTVYSFDGTLVNPTLSALAVPAGPSSIAIDPGAGAAFVGNVQSNTVSRIDLASGRVTATVATAYYPDNIAIDTSTHIVFVASRNDGSIHSFDGRDPVPTSKKVVSVRGALSLTVDPIDHLVYVADGYTVRYFDGRADAPLLLDGTADPYPVRYLHLVAADPKGGHVYAIRSEPMTSFDTIWKVVPLPATSPAIMPVGVNIYAVGSWVDLYFSGTGNPLPSLSFGGTLPPGLAWSAGTLSGRVTTVGHSTFTLTASNGVGPGVVRSYDFVVTPPPPSLVTSDELPVARVGTYYRFNPVGVSPLGVTCSVTSGRLPAGIVLASAGCALTGKPTTPGPFSFRLTATNEGGSSSVEYMLTVSPVGTSPCLRSEIAGRQAC
ncbi:putative Ig domain-containing protein [Subtercola boreus]|nr:putative Ig domain-containing protein [Subtercola boreus]